MAKTEISLLAVCLVCSLILNALLVKRNNVGLGGKLMELSWAKRAAEEAEAVSGIACSGHGRAYVDGVLADGTPVCECHTCFQGRHCSTPTPNCVANVNEADPVFLEPYWVRHAAGSTVVVTGWHRMSYEYDDHSYTSRSLETYLRRLHATVGNAVTDGKFIVFGTGSTQLLNAAVHALSTYNSSAPAKVVVSIPFDPVYQRQTDFFRSLDYQFEGDASMWKKNSDGTLNLIEFVTAPNNPDGKLNKAVLQGPHAKAIHDHAYYWPHFTAIPAPADEDLMIFSISELTGHAGSRFGWAVIKDEGVYQKMSEYVGLNTMGVSRDTQLRALKLLKVALEGNGRELFEFSYTTMKARWEKLRHALSASNRFTTQKIAPQYCTFFQAVRDPTPAYAWLKCEREEDKDCNGVLKEAGIIGHDGTSFGANSSYVRLSLIGSQDDFDTLLRQINKLVAEEDGSKSSM